MPVCNSLSSEPKERFLCASSNTKGCSVGGCQTLVASEDFQGLKYESRLAKTVQCHKTGDMFGSYCCCSFMWPQTVAPEGQVANTWSWHLHPGIHGLESFSFTWPMQSVVVAGRSLTSWFHSGLGGEEKRVRWKWSIQLVTLTWLASGNLFMETEQGTLVFLLVKISVTDQCEITQGLESLKPQSPSAWFRRGIWSTSISEIGETELFQTNFVHLNLIYVTMTPTWG